MKKLLLLSLLILVSCQPESNIKPTTDRTNQDISIKVIFHESNKSLEDAYRIANNLSDNVPVPDQWGFAQWNQWADRDGNLIDLPDQPYWCTIHVMKPKRQNDRPVLALGHEMMHCLYGSYHD